MTRICLVLAPLSSRHSATRARTDRLVREILIPALKSLGFEVLHADHIGMPGLVLAQVIELVVTADLVIADLTDANPNVMYELAVRHCTGKPTIQVSDDVTQLPFYAAQGRTIPLDVSSEEGIQRAIREVTRHATSILAAASAPSPVTALFDTSFVARGPTVLGDALVPPRVDDGVRAERPLADHVGNSWRFAPTDAMEESLLRVADSQAVTKLSTMMLECLRHNPYAGKPTMVQGHRIYVLHSKVPGAAPLRLVYTLDERDHVIVPLLFVTGEDRPRTTKPGDFDTPAAAFDKDAIVHLLQTIGRRWH